MRSFPGVPSVSRAACASAALRRADLAEVERGALGRLEVVRRDRRRAETEETGLDHDGRGRREPRQRDEADERRDEDMTRLTTSHSGAARQAAPQ
jgi:hypothetical protein